MIRLLLWIGFVKLRDGRVVWPFKLPPRYIFASWSGFVAYCKFWGFFYAFRNSPYVIKRIPGRLLPRRWGFGVCGFEFGDRG